MSKPMTGKEKGIIAGIVGGIVAIIIALNSFTIVSTNHEASVSSFGEVHEGKILTGFNWVAPWWSIDEYSLQHDTMSYDDLGVASQDKFKTNMDVAFTGSFLKGNADKTRMSTGKSERFKDVHVYKRVLSCLTKAGAEVKDSQAFFDKEVQEGLADSTIGCVNEYLATVGTNYKLSAVQFSDIRLDKRVQNFIVETKKREEGERQQESATRAANEKAKILVQDAKARNDAAEHDKEARKKAADAKFYEMQQEAKGNEELSKSLSPELVEYMKAQRWNGQLPTVQAGQGSEFLIDTRSK